MRSIQSFMFQLPCKRHLLHLSSFNLRAIHARPTSVILLSFLLGAIEIKLKSIQNLGLSDALITIKGEIIYDFYPIKPAEYHEIRVRCFFFKSPIICGLVHFT